MIVKCLSRKSNSFRQMITYLNKRIEYKDVPWIIGNNIEGDIYDIEEVVRAFKTNDQYRKKRKNGVVMYHDILSLPSGIREECLSNPNKLMEIAYTYINEKNPQAIAYGVPHFYQNNNPHVHIVFSANEFGSEKSVRISKQRMKQIKKSIDELEKSYFVSKVVSQSLEI